MSRVYVEHPYQWVGVPETFPYEQWDTAEQWGAELAQTLGEDFAEPQSDQLQRLGSYLATVAESRDKTETSRLFVSVDDWGGPAYIAELVIIPRSLAGDATLEQLAGADDPDAVEAPIIEAFVAESGAEGVRSVRYLNPPGLDGLLVRADFVWPTDEGFVRLFTAQFDLVAFERVLPRLTALAATVRIE